MNATSYLAISCLKLLNEEDGLSYPRVQGFLLTHTYVDDIIAGTDSVKEVKIRGLFVINSRMAYTK